MSKFEKSEGYSREVYDKTAEDETSLKAQIAEAKSADEMMAIAMKLKEAEGKKTELDNEAYDEAMTEEQERTKKEKEEAENKMWDEALAENAEFDQSKELDKAAENLKNQLGKAKSADEMIDLANQMKEIESRKAMLTEKSKKELEIASQKDKSDSSEKAEEIISGLGGMMGEAQLTRDEMAVKYGFRSEEENARAVKQTNRELKSYTDAQEKEKIIEMLDAPKVLELKRVREKEYKERILDDLKKNIPQDKEVMVLMLKDKIGSFDDKESPVFVYGKENVGEATKVINEWVDNIDSKHYMLPALATEYFFSIMSEEQFEKAVENPVLVANDNLRKAVEKYKGTVENEKLYDEANHLLKNLFDARGLDPFWGAVPKECEDAANRLREIFKTLDQAALAQKFFDDTIGRRIDNNKQAYMVYGLLKGTAFANKFKELESARLKRAGYSELTI